MSADERELSETLRGNPMKRNKEVVITRDEWLEAFGTATLHPINQNALTTTELAERYGLSRRRMGERIRKLIKEDKVTVCRKTIEDNSGALRTVTAYLLKK